jgi:hypothetical protein
MNSRWGNEDSEAGGMGGTAFAFIPSIKVRGFSPMGKLSLLRLFSSFFVNRPE